MHKTLLVSQRPHRSKGELAIEAPNWLNDLPIYIPGEPGSTNALRLASNESSIGPAPSAVQAVREALGNLHRYPSPLADNLRDAIAAEHNLSPDCVLVGNGSDELIMLLGFAYGFTGGSMVAADPPYALHLLAAKAGGLRPILVPLQEYRHDLDAMATAVEAKLVFVCNPHNPTGTVVTSQDIGELVRTTAAALVVVDEAYLDFADAPATSSAIALVEGGRVAVLRTFSKLYGLAGLRVGYLVAHQDLVTGLRRLRAPFSVSSLGQIAALAALGDTAFIQAHRNTVLANRRILESTLRDCGFEPIPSQANFVLAAVGDEGGVVRHLQNRGVMVRPGSVLGMPGFVRVGVPDDQGMLRLLNALTTFTTSG